MNYTSERNWPYLLISFLLIFTFFQIPSSGDAQLREITLYVGGTGPGNYTTIQEAIDNASNGNTVFVYNGTYYGHVHVNKTIELIGEDKNSTIISGYIAYTVTIASDRVDMHDFTIFNENQKGEGVRIDSDDNTFYNNIIDTEDDNIRIHGNGNNISNNDITCVTLIVSGSSNTFLNNTINNSYHGIYFASSQNNIFENNSFLQSGFFISNDNVRNKRVANNVVNGKPLVYLQDTAHQIVNADAGQIILVNCSNIIIQQQNISNTTVGIQLISSKYCNLSENTMLNNHYGFWITGNNNMISTNSFVNNTHEALRIYGNNNTFSNNSATHNNIGFYLYYSNYNHIKNNNIQNNNQEGIILDYSSDFNNIYTNNIFENQRGISIYSSDNNIIYNNYLNNTINAFDERNNSWNISKTTQQNVIGGPFIAGNFWSDYNGTDQNNDGIGDTNIPCGPGDFLPLTAFLDINQSTHDRGFPIRHAFDGDWGAAQNFNPNYDILSYTQIYIRKFGSPEFNLTVELREDSIDGPILDTLVFTPTEIENTWTWLTIDSNDVPITPGINYFIKCPPAPSGVTTSFGYEWGYAFGNQYDDGSFWFTRDGGNLWRDLPTMYEFMFKIYGYN